MFVTPASFDSFGRELTHDAAEQLARNWTTLLLNGLVLIVAGVLIWSIDWSVRSLSTFIGALFVFEGLWVMLTAGISQRMANLVTGLLSIAAGIAIIVWPSPSLTVLGIFLGAWLIVVGLALAEPGATLAALITVGGIWAVAVGVTRVVLAFQLRHLPKDVDEALALHSGDGTATPSTRDPGRIAPAS
jgi:uncharacterized membrane protein HdeD (DUF308 family)